MYYVFQSIITDMSKDMCTRIVQFNFNFIFITERRNMYICVYIVYRINGIIYD